MVVGIRVDGNSEIGTGHIHRCFSIAEELQKMGAKVLFLVTQKETAYFIKDRGFQCEILNSKWDEIEGEEEFVLEMAREKGIRKLLIDSYYVTEKYLRKLRKELHIIYIDDLNMDWLPSDILISYVVYSKRRYPHADHTLLGCEYTPLRMEFSNVTKHKIRPCIKNILIVSGGTDPQHFGKKFWNAYIEERKKRKEFQDIRITIVCGKYSEDYRVLKTISEKEEMLEIIHDTQRMSSLMRDADLAVSAGGVTLYELCACGTPSISYSFVDNQLENVKSFHELGLIECSGDLRKNYNWQNLMYTIAQYTLEPEMRRKRSRKMQRLVDGQGAKRIAEAIVGFEKSRH